MKKLVLMLAVVASVSLFSCNSKAEATEEAAAEVTEQVVEAPAAEGEEAPVAEGEEAPAAEEAAPAEAAAE